MGIQYLIDFDRLNKNIWYNEYYRIKSFFEGTEYANADVRSYGFNPTKALESFERAGFHRPDADRASGTLAKLRNVVYGLIFTRSDMDDILVNDKGQKASFSLIYANKNSESALTIIQQDFRRAGVDMNDPHVLLPVHDRRQQRIVPAREDVDMVSGTRKLACHVGHVDVLPAAVDASDESEGRSMFTDECDLHCKTVLWGF